MPRTAHLIAVGGNSLIRAGEKGTIAEQLANTRRTARAIVGLIQDGLQPGGHARQRPAGRGGAAALRAGVGPGVRPVARRLRRDDAGRDRVPAAAVAAERAGGGRPRDAGRDGPDAGGGLRATTRRCATRPSRSARSTRAPTPRSERGALGWQIVEDAARGYRRVVPSPEPIEIVEEPVIRDAARRRACWSSPRGGGGIPVVRDDRRGSRASRRSSTRTARRRCSPAGSASTASSSRPTRTACTSTTSKPTQRPLERVTAAEMRGTTPPGQFPPGNMGPKIESALRFLEDGGREVIITSYEHLRGGAGRRGRTSCEA